MEYFFLLMIENNTEHSLIKGFIKKFGPTKFCSVRQNLELHQTNVWQNSQVIRQHWIRCVLYLRETCLYTWYMCKIPSTNMFVLYLWLHCPHKCCKNKTLANKRWLIVNQWKKYQEALVSNTPVKDGAMTDGRQMICEILYYRGDTKFKAAH